MNKENKLNNFFMKSAELSATLSYCERKKVGAVLVKDSRIIVNSYNGTISGSENCCEETIYDGFGAHKVSKNTVVHAEMNCILFAGKYGIATQGCDLFVTLSPCIECSKAIIQAGIKSVYYKEEYRNTEGIKFLSQFISVIKLED